MTTPNATKTTLGTTLLVVSSVDFNQNVMTESSNWRSWHLRTNPSACAKDELIHPMHTFSLRGTQYIECSKDDTRCRLVKWLGGVGRSLVAGWCLIDSEKNVVDMSTTFAKYVGGGDLFGQKAGGLTHFRELLTEAPIATDWIAGLSDQIAELEGYRYGADYDSRIIAPLRAARAEITQTLTA